jgi:Ca2+-binding EF-hand superfamily protein
MAEAKLPAFKLTVDDLTRSAAEAGLPFWTREKLQGLFHLFDTDRDNTIERNEFEYVAKQLLQLIEPPKGEGEGEGEGAGEGEGEGEGET